MNGFKNDVLAILDSNTILQKESMGWVVAQHTTPDNSELYNYLQSNGFPVTNQFEKSVFFFDYIVIDRMNASLKNLLKALSLLSVGGVLVIELAEYYFEDSYFSVFGNFTITKVRYDDRKYLVFHTGVDYGH